MTRPQRERLAAAQEDLLNALLADGPVPDGFDPERVRVERRALLNKRRAIVASLRPEVAAELGERFRPLFDEYASSRPRRVGTRFREDAAAFAEWATARGELAAPKRRWWRRAT
ncbi:hypothetical protein [Saccharothrix syringae]|uniref:SCO6045-like C-terminal domain-containing protein n=1 Tax=Saccharothrix syringae TaxID=103733 RepID=A0A5Q0GVV5_SACSY|nr:hypothetical protein [Saccharothrix syringae]QFZ17624.1 hypothetical protein EKG83_09150 [Saccharothrix syringae]